MDAIPTTKGIVAGAVSKPYGGFRPISVTQVCAAWWAYKSGILPRYLDFRVYLALHEIDERRLAAARSRAKKGRAMLHPVLPVARLVAETVALTGRGSERLVRQSLRRVAAAGLITLNSSGISFMIKVENLRGEITGDLPCLVRQRLRRTGMRDRRLPVPRSILRFLAGGASPSVAATVYGYLVRCMWWRERACGVSGSCTAAFISDLFDIDVRSVKRARAELREIGWLVDMPVSDDEAAVTCLPNLLWSSARRNAPRVPPRSRPVLSPLRTGSGTKMSPGSSLVQLRSGSKYQQPRRGKETGISEGKEAETLPRLANVMPADLASPERLGLLFEEAATKGLVQRTEAGRLAFFAAAQRAKRVATRNPEGFFAAVVRGRLWHVISQDDEDRARVCLNGGDGRLPGEDRPSKECLRPTARRTLVQDHRASGSPINELLQALAKSCSLEDALKKRAGSGAGC